MNLYISKDDTYTLEIYGHEFEFSYISAKEFVAKIGMIKKIGDEIMKSEIGEREIDKLFEFLATKIKRIDEDKNISKEKIQNLSPQFLPKILNAVIQKSYLEEDVKSFRNGTEEAK